MRVLKNWRVIGGITLAVFLLGACQSEPAPASDPAPAPEPEVKDAVEARDAALASFRERFPAMAPGAGRQWQDEAATPEGLVGQATREFVSDGLTVRVSSPVVAPEHVTYDVTVVSEPDGWLWQATVKPDGAVTETSPPTGMSKEWSQDIAERFLKSSPTYSFDGIEETLKLADTMTARCPFCWVFTFEFDSRHAGYGDRQGMMLAQVITPHTAAIAVEQGEITSAVLDEKWDIIRQEEID